jgi:D-alanine-D-alanine ligase
MALRAYKALGCRGMGRVDMIVDKNGKPYVLEINTIPGMTQTSLYPDAAKATGFSFPDLLERLINLSTEK